MAKNESAKEDSNQYFPPVITVLGHVDHGKTTLLDAVRKTSIADREKGGITQKIGASEVEIEHEGKKRKITFIDTPGHEAFTKMRGHGVNVSDVSLLIVAATDGVKPQTKESIQILQDSGTPFIVVITKVDMPHQNINDVKQSIVREGVMLEGLGGDVPVIEISAKTGQNIKELLDLILLVFDLHKPADYFEKISKSAPVSAVVIESKLDTRVGPKAAVVVKNGVLKVREEVQIEGEVFKIRSLMDDRGKQLLSACAGQAVEVFGFKQVPPVGGVITDKSVKVEKRSSVKDEPLAKTAIYTKKEEHKGLSVILVADTLGSLEAITSSLPDGVKIVLQKTGEVTDADVVLAKSTGSIVLSFGTKIKPDITKLAMNEKVLLRNYEVIYELIDEIKDAQEGKLASQMEQIYGVAHVLAKFPYEKTQALGVKIDDGRLAKGDRVRIMRGDEVVGENSIKSLRVGKDTTSKVEVGKEAGVVLAKELDILVGDVILSHS